MAVLKFDKRLKSILAKQGVLPDPALGEALAKAEETEQSLTQVLLDSGQTTEDVLLAALSQETHLPPINVFKIKSDESLASLLPENLANYYGVIPVSKVGNIITLAVSNPFDILQLDDIQIVTGCDIRPVLSTDISIRKAIPEVYNRGQQMVQNLLDNMHEPDVEVKEAPKDSDVEDISNISSESGQAPVVKLVNVVIFQGIQHKASDIHIEPLDKQ